jgi:hypothetical protein
MCYDGCHFVTKETWMARLNTTCPECGAPHARKLSAVHAEGLSTVDTKIEAVSTAKTIGRQKVVTNGAATGVQQTDASKKAAPPAIETGGSTGVIIKALLLFVGAVIAIPSLVNSVMVGVIAGVVIAFIGVLLPLEITPADEEEKARRTGAHKRAMDEWNKTFECSACSHRFVPVEAQAA